MKINKQYGKISTDDIRLFLEFWPQLKDDFHEACTYLSENEHDFFTKDSPKFSFCHLYELPIKHHVSTVLSPYLQDNEALLNIFKDSAATDNQIAFLPEMVTRVSSHFDSMPPSTESERLDFAPYSTIILASASTMYHALNCVLYHGCFLNELIERVRDGNDKSLFDAIRIDPTVIGCKSVIERISKAALLRDKSFFTKLGAALKGNVAKREQANYQKMRLVLELLSECKADALNDDQLHELFVLTLKLYSPNEHGGGSTKSLRKFVDTYTRKQSTT